MRKKNYILWIAAWMATSLSMTSCRAAQQFSDKSSVYTFMVIELVVFCLAIYYLYKKIEKIENKAPRVRHSHTSSGDDDTETQDLSAMKRSLEKLVKQINHKNAEQTQRMEDMEKRLTKLESPYASYSQYETNPYQPRRENKEDELLKTGVFYMPRTLTKMQFEDSKKKYAKDDTSYFKFTVKEGRIAEFVFDPYDESYIGRAYDDRDNSLLTVCELDATSTTPKSFRNIEPGEAELRGHVWVVTKKLKLQYV